MTEQHERASPRLQFTKEELDNPELDKPIHKAEKAADKYEKAQSKLKKKRTLKLSREETDAESPVNGNQPAEAME